MTPSTFLSCSSCSWTISRSTSFGDAPGQRAQRLDQRAQFLPRHQMAGGSADLDVRVVAAADRHRHDRGAAVDDENDERGVAARDDRVLRHQQRLALGLQRNLDAAEHAVLERGVAVGNFDPQREGAGHVVGDGHDGHDGARERAARVRVGAHVHARAGHDAADVAFGQIDADLHAREVHQLGDGAAGGHPLAQFRAFGRDDPVERRGNDLLLQRALQPPHLLSGARGIVAELLLA